MSIAAKIAALRAEADALEAQAAGTTPEATAAGPATDALTQRAPVPVPAQLAHAFQVADLHALRAASAFNANQDELLHKLIDAVAELQAQHQPDSHA